MARVKQLDQIVGNIGKLSFYTRKGSNEVFVRTKGGATKDQIKRLPQFEKLRKNNMEFGGCSKMSKRVRLSFYGLEHVADFNLAPALNSLMKSIQKTDDTHAVGQRDIRLSAYKYVLAGFDFGRTTRFASLLRVPLASTIHRDTRSATLQIPAFDCSFGLNTTQTSLGKYGHFRITAALGIVTDMQLNASANAYEPMHDNLGHGFQVRSTPWYSIRGTVAQQTLELNVYNELMPPENFTDADSLVLTVIVEAGMPDALGNIMPVRGVGGGAIMSVE